MITFDRLKLVSTIDNIIIRDENVFEQVVKDGELQSLNYYQESPYLLRIKIDYPKNEFVIEFSGKVLCSDYPKLICADTIRQCFDNINNLGFCFINTEAMMNSEVISCDVTKDIKWDNIPKLATYIRGHISNYNQFNCKVQCGNVTIEKNVISRKCKKRMIIYDKGREMSNSMNKKFVQSNGLEGKFDGVCRFEMNLKSKKQIRDSLLITDTKLISALTTESTPIVNFIKDAVSPPVEPTQVNDRKSYFTSLVLKDCDYDIAKIEAKMRELYKRGTKFSEVMKPYREALEMINIDSNDTYQKLIEKLK